MVVNFKKNQVAAVKLANLSYTYYFQDQMHMIY